MSPNNVFILAKNIQPSFILLSELNMIKFRSHFAEKFEIEEKEVQLSLQNILSIILNSVKSPTGPLVL